jgi:hypothetical protein
MPTGGIPCGATPGFASHPKSWCGTTFAVRELSRLVDVILAAGAKNSSNSNRLKEIGAESGKPDCERPGT